MARPLLLIALLSCAAQTVRAQATSQPISIGLPAGATEAVRYRLEGPGDQLIQEGACAAHCEIAVGWWRGPGSYTMTAGDPASPGTATVELRGTESSVWVGFDAASPTFGVIWSDPRIRARIVGLSAPFEIENATDVELVASTQNGRTNWRIEPVEAGLTEAERGERSSSSWGFCGYGISEQAIPSHGISTLPAFARPSLRALSAGRYRGSFDLAPSARVEGVWETYRVSFEIDLIVDPSARHGLRMELVTPTTR